MAMYDIYMPTAEDAEKLILAKSKFDEAKGIYKTDAEIRDWGKGPNWHYTPWGIAYDISKSKFDKSKAYSSKKGATQKTEDYHKKLRT